MRLYSVQPLFVYDLLLKGQTYRPQPQLQDGHWLSDEDDHARRAYNWLCEQMQRRGLERPAPDCYPVWAWFQWYGPRRARPDLRTSSLKSWAAEERHVLFELEVPADQVLLHDYDAWHAVLNYWYLGRPGQCNAFERRCKALGASYYRDKPLKDAALHEELVASWEQIFDMRAARQAMGSRHREQVIQATFWELRMAHVLSALEFGAGRRSQPLPLQPQALTA